MTTIGEALRSAAARLAGAGVPGPQAEARLLLAHAAALDTTTIIGHPERDLEPAAEAACEALVARRARREPLAQIIGTREFWSLPFIVTRDTLTPRPDSETLVEAALDALGDRTSPWRILDLGTGTGCLLLALLREMPRASGIGIDRSEAALAVARQNAAVMGLAGRARFVVGDWMRAVDGRFDLVVTNPPYVRADDIDALAPEVSRHEPRLALDGGVDGLGAYRAIAADLGRVLAADGVAVLEVGAGQADAVIGILSGAGLRQAMGRADLAGIIRCLVTGRKDGVAQKTVGKLGVSV